MSSHMDRLPLDVANALRKDNDEVIELFRMLNAREAGLNLLPPADEPAALAIVCLCDLSHILQSAGQSIHVATTEWTLQTQSGALDSREGTAMAVSSSRQHLDRSIVALSAASNHLASAMWHLHEKIFEPLGRGYKSAAQVRREWAARTGVAPSSQATLDILLNHPDWVTVSTYRDDWIHRGLPVLVGELRQARRRIWMLPTDPPPGEFFLTITAPDGRVAYAVQGDTGTHEFQKLLKTTRAAMFLLMNAVRSFLPLIDERLTASGAQIHENGVRITLRGPFRLDVSVNQPAPPQ